MNFTILNGMHPGQKPLEAIHQQLEKYLSGSDHTIHTFNLHQYDIPWCKGDFYCWIKTPGECMLKGISSEIGQSLIASDVAVYITPVTFGGYSSQLKKALDHQIGLILPHFQKIQGETHHKARYDRYPRLTGIGYMKNNDADQEKIFSKLIERNAINMHAPAHAACVIVPQDTSERIGTKMTLMFKKIGINV
jgi:multimeric flavodoxin WrbA